MYVLTLCKQNQFYSDIHFTVQSITLRIALVSHTHTCVCARALVYVCIYISLSQYSQPQFSHTSKVIHIW
jgi:hypothetical protein